MEGPVDYDASRPHQFGGVLPHPREFADSAAVILPIPLDRTTSYVSGTRHGPRELLLASAQVELWDEELSVDVHPHGMVTLPELDLSSLPLESAIAEIGRVATALFDTGKFLVTLGGEHSITSALVRAASARHRGLTVLQIDAHADLRDVYQEQRHSHACAMRRTIEYAPLVRSGSAISRRTKSTRCRACRRRCSMTGTCVRIPRGSIARWPRSGMRSTSRSISTAWIRPPCRPWGRPSPADSPGAS